MAYDNRKDKPLSQQEVATGDNESIIVGLYSYDEGEPKLGLSRKTINTKKNTAYHKSIGRISQDEWARILPAIRTVSQALMSVAIQVAPTQVQPVTAIPAPPAQVQANIVPQPNNSFFQ